jgi:hypothetical protein
MPITSCPCSFNSAAATELSTPPLIATTILAMMLLLIYAFTNCSGNECGMQGRETLLLATQFIVPYTIE